MSVIFQPMIIAVLSELLKMQERSASVLTRNLLMGNKTAYSRILFGASDSTVKLWHLTLVLFFIW